MRQHTGYAAATRRALAARQRGSRTERVDPRAPLSPRSLLAAQRLAGNSAVAALVQRQEDEAVAGQRVRSVLQSGGAPLDAAFQTRAENYLGAELSHVRVHHDRAAAASARAVQSQAYTSGSHIVFGSGKYDPASSVGQQRLAHELTHVVQQQRGPVAGTVGASGLKISDPSDRFEREAERVGKAFVSDGAAHHIKGNDSAGEDD
ncbi:MAG: DUF4157 domain-containing protein [Pseudonocardiaceae bacterium]|nr:DUF4157 domain-containing protein [Pseudonocardiaceae bacterium]